MDDLTEESNDKPKGRNNLQGLILEISGLILQYWSMI